MPSFVHSLLLFFSIVSLVSSSNHTGNVQTTCSSFVKPLDNNFGAEVYGVDLNNFSEADIEAIDQYLLTYKVLVIKNQESLTVDGQRAFTARFGHLLEHLETTSHLPGYRDVNVVSNIVVNGAPTGLSGEHVENYHSDLSWNDLPTKITFLKGEILPENEGHTYFADSTRAYDALSDAMQERLRGVDAHYSYMKFRDTIPGVSPEAFAHIKAGSTHPLIATHPTTGNKSIYANIAHTIYVKGVSAEESTEILEVLFEIVNRPEYIYVHKWSKGDMVMWDNRATQHKATPCPSARKLIRTTVKNDHPPVYELQLEKPFIPHTLEPASVCL